MRITEILNEDHFSPLRAELVEVLPPWDFEVAITDPSKPNAPKRHFIIRPGDLTEMQTNRLQIMDADLVDLQTGTSKWVELEDNDPVFDAISDLFWNDQNLNKLLFNIVRHSQNVKQGHKPLPGVVRPKRTEIPADEFIRGAQAEKDLYARLTNPKTVNTKSK